MARRENAETIAEEIRRRLRHEILTGVWEPGERLQPSRLAASYDASTTVVREVLTRLTAERLVHLRPNRGFFVPDLSVDELRDLNELRIVTEQLALGLAIERADEEWADRVQAAHEVLAATPQRDAEDPLHLADAWVVAHRSFHAALISACRFPTLIDLCSSLNDGTELYRRWAVPAAEAETRDVAAEDAGILRAALGRDADLATLLLRRHYETTMANIASRRPPRAEDEGQVSIEG